MSSKGIRFGIVAALVILGFATLGILAHRFSAQAALAKYKAELRARGEKLTCAELLPGQQSNYQWTLTAFTNAASKLTPPTGFIPGSFTPMRFVGEGKARAAWREVRPRVNYQGAATAPSWSNIAAQIEFNRSAVEQIRGTLNPAPPSTAQSAGPRTHGISYLIILRNSAQWMMAAALSDLHQGRIEDALSNVEGVMNLALVNRNELRLVDQMIRVAIGSLAVQATWECLEAENISEPHLARMQRGLEELELLAGIEFALVGERALGCELWGIAHKTSGARLRRSLNATGKMNPLEATFADFVFVPVYQVTSLPTDELLFLKSIQAGIDAVRALEKGFPWVQSQTNLLAFNESLKKLANTSGQFQYWISTQTIPNISRAIVRSVQVQTELRLAIAAVALKRYELRHNDIPEQLDGLVPEFVRSPSVDPMSGKPLMFRRLTPSTFLLYSVGEDGIDNQGEARPEKAGDAYGFWSSPDAVWPACVNGAGDRESVLSP